MRVIFICIVFSVFYSCNSRGSLSMRPYSPSNKQQSVNEINRRSLYKIKKEYGLRPFGTGAQMMNKIEMLCLSFQHNHLADIKEARMLVIGAANIFLSEINAHEEVRQYLVEYPFKLQDIRVEIFFRETNGRNVPPENLVIAVLDKGNLSYRVHPKEDPNLLVDIWKESLEEALTEIEKLERLAI